MPQAHSPLKIMDTYLEELSPRASRWLLNKVKNLEDDEANALKSSGFVERLECNTFIGTLDVQSQEHILVRALFRDFRYAFILNKPLYYTTGLVYEPALHDIWKWLRYELQSANPEAGQKTSDSLFDIDAYELSVHELEGIAHTECALRQESDILRAKVFRIFSDCLQRCEQDDFYEQKLIARLGERFTFDLLKDLTRCYERILPLKAYVASLPSLIVTLKNKDAEAFVTRTSALIKEHPELAPWVFSVIMRNLLYPKDLLYLIIKSCGCTTTTDILELHAGSCGLRLLVFECERMRECVAKELKHQAGYRRLKPALETYVQISQALQTLSGELSPDLNKRMYMLKTELSALLRHEIEFLPDLIVSLNTMLSRFGTNTLPLEITNDNQRIERMFAIFAFVRTNADLFNLNTLVLSIQKKVHETIRELIEQLRLCLINHEGSDRVGLILFSDMILTSMGHLFERDYVESVSRRLASVINEKSWKRQSTCAHPFDSLIEF